MSNADRHDKKGKKKKNKGKQELWGGDRTYFQPLPRPHPVLTSPSPLSRPHNSFSLSCNTECPAPWHIPSAGLQPPLPKCGNSRGLSQARKNSIWTLPLAQLDRDSRVWRHGYPRGHTGGKGNEPIAPPQKLPLTFQRSLHKLREKILQDQIGNFTFLSVFPLTSRQSQMQECLKTLKRSNQSFACSAPTELVWLFTCSFFSLFHQKGHSFSSCNT